MRYLSALWAFLRRDLRIGRRRPDLVVQTVAVPLVVFGLASIIFGASDAWPTALVDDDHSAASAQVISAVHGTAGARGPYFDVLTDDAVRAGDLLRTGRGQLAVRLPAGFSTDQTMDVTTYNINTDTMKNVRLRLVTMANRYDAQHGHQQVSATIVKTKPQDVSRTAFMGGGAIVLALLLGSCLISANLFAMEQEIRTTKELVLTPLGAPVGALGAAAAGVLLSLLTALPTALMAVGFGFRTDLAGLARGALVLAPAMVAAAGLGVLVAQLLRTHRAIQPTIILLALGTYFAAGGFIPVPGLPPTARAFAELWPPSYVFAWVNPLLHGFSDELPVSRLLVLATTAVVGGLLAYLSGVREGRRPTASGQ